MGRRQLFHFSRLYFAINFDYKVYPITWAALSNSVSPEFVFYSEGTMLEHKILSKYMYCKEMALKVSEVGMKMPGSMPRKVTK